MSIQRRARGFTLVELLVVISIIGILAAMLLPAVQAAREAGLRTQCRNNIRNMVQACQQHESAHGHFPTGGWGYGWAGEPDRAFGKKQPGGWMFNILPYLEETTLREMGKGESDANRKAKGKDRVAVVVQAFVCPSRRRADQYTYIPKANHYKNITTPNLVGKADYAANGGSLGFDTGAKCEGPPLTALTGPDSAIDGQCNAINMKADGIVFTRSEVKAAHIRDGLSKTYLLGERYLHTNAYDNTLLSHNDQGWDTGYDWDVNRWTKHAPEFDLNLLTGDNSFAEAFGSVHQGAFHMGLADGSVKSVDYLISLPVHKAFGSRDGKELVDASEWIIE